MTQFFFEQFLSEPGFGLGSVSVRHMTWASRNLLMRFNIYFTTVMRYLGFPIKIVTMPTITSCVLFRQLHHASRATLPKAFSHRSVDMASDRPFCELLRVYCTNNLLASMESMAQEGLTMGRFAQNVIFL